MGTSVSTNVALNSTTQTSVNDFYQNLESTCNSTCIANQSNIFINIQDSTVSDISVDNTCSATADCSMTNTLSTLSTTTLAQEQSTSQSNSTSFTPIYSGITVQTNLSVNTTQQTIDNTTTQIINTSCIATSENYQTDVTINIGNSTTGDIDVTNTGASEAGCAMNNTASAVSYTQATSTQTANQENAKGPSLYFAIFLIIFVIIGFLVYKERDDYELKMATLKSQESIAAINVVAQRGQGVEMATLGTAPTSVPTSVPVAIPG